MPVASILDSVTNAIGDHGIYAVFLLMALDAVFPAASELIMVYAGALASGAIAGQGVFLVGFGRISSGLAAYLAGQRIRNVLLAPKHKPGRARPHPRWRVVPNAKVEVDQ